MAEGNDSGLKDLEQEIICGICHEHYKDPKVLSCCHYYCKECIYTLSQKAGLDKGLICPECRKGTILPKGGVDDLQRVCFVDRLKHVHSKIERATGIFDLDSKCELCSQEETYTAYCQQCAQFICAECVKSHQRIKKAFPGHKIFTLMELKEGGAREIVTPETTIPTCEEHEQQSINMFCFDCDCLICRDCTIKDHHGHNYEFVKKAAPGVKKKLGQKLEPLKGVKKDLMSAVKEVQTTRSELKAEGNAVVKRVEDWCDKLCQIIQDHKKQLVQEANNKIAQKSSRLLDQERGLSNSSAGADGIIGFTQSFMEYSTDDEMMCMYAELQRRIDNKIKEKEKTNLEPVEKADVDVEVSGAKELKQLCQTKAKITPIPLVGSKKQPGKRRSSYFKIN